MPRLDHAVTNIEVVTLRSGFGQLFLEKEIILDLRGRLILSFWKEGLDEIRGIDQN